METKSCYPHARELLFDNCIAKQDPDRLLNCAEVAYLLHVSVYTIRGWVFDRKIPHLKAGKSVRFVWADVLRWAQIRET